ncbi:MAG: rod shape-determining protein MreC [Cyclobacteriaceae bacterium]|nr:rod shape-determining protein MreC [Cyclobacteriaceae bacterium]
MGRLFLLLFKYRAMLVFVLLEILSSWMILSSDLSVSASAFNSSNQIVAKIILFSNATQNYFGLTTLNQELAHENAKLRQELTSLQQSVINTSNLKVDDTEIISQYEYQDAKVINNTTQWLNNYITIDKGSSNGLAPDMGVINQHGVVGKIHSVSKHYAVLVSLLHNNVLVSSKIKRTGTIGTINWGGSDPQIADLKYIPRHISPSIGDTIVTSGYNAVFPEDIPIGIIEAVELKEDKNFNDIKVKLENDFTKLSFVYVIKNKLKIEKDSIEFENFILDTNE